MAREIRITCDCCGKLKGDNNHWWVIRVEDALHLYTFEWIELHLDYHLLHKLQYLCGYFCVSKVIASFMDKTINTQNEPLKDK